MSINFCSYMELKDSVQKQILKLSSTVYIKRSSFTMQLFVRRYVDFEILSRVENRTSLVIPDSDQQIKRKVTQQSSVTLRPFITLSDPHISTTTNFFS